MFFGYKNFGFLLEIIQFSWETSEFDVEICEVCWFFEVAELLSVAFAKNDWFDQNFTFFSKIIKTKLKKDAKINAKVLFLHDLMQTSDAKIQK